MTLDPVPLECVKCAKETMHSVNFTEHAKAAGTLVATCSVFDKIITMQITGMGSHSSISDRVKTWSKLGSYKRKIIKGNF